MAETRKDIEDELRKKIDEDRLSSDIKLSLFSAALQSYRHDTVLRPFPPQFIKSDTEKDNSKLSKVFSEILKLTKLVPCLNSMSLDALKLLKWALDSKRFKTKLLGKNSFEMIIKLTGSTTPVPPPTHIFEIEYNEASEQKFQDKRQDRGVIFAYHGSRTENFHSILHNGLASHMNKVSVFGEGTYLSGELSVSLNYSPSGFTWENSEIGHKVGCVAVCEIIDDPATVKRQVSEKDGVKTKSRASAKNSEAGDVPDKYFVVESNEVIRVKYLLVYADKASHKHLNNRPTFFQQHKFVIMLVFYGCILLAVGLANSRTFKYHIRKFLK
ncbi:hypothetical protein LOTGIDRAFT_198000 [Lottia gigantea]|uniref:Poly [ADP-ribose] polymerase n=1 Tax=Lottia gigantea TaxID=225164 RepID=V3ZED1_LOTGI|nr:hypothetical protein LOTGIDRAFT_198000 [Lottia gigantea]ESO82417.1 hypothetical protein LOTGIDRAFT_198000 [Lottia gigantea]